tara:strand:- start:746 stop:1684 length:939 start_codon:yes stop_codon:yes gene_type:complete
MKFIGQNIQDFISRFRNDVYLESISTGTIASGGNLGLDSNNKIVKANEASGGITGVTITTDSGGGSKAEDTSGSADFSILGASGVGVTNSGVVITVTSVPGEIDHDSLLNFVANEHIDWTGSSAGTIHSTNIPTLNQDTTGNASTVTSIGNLTGDVTSSNRATTIANDAVTFAKAQGVTPKVFDNKIKLIPSDFMANDDGGNQKFGVGYVETPGAGYGMRTANNATELYAFVSIPQGMTATHVDIFDKNDLAVEVFEAQINATTMTSKGSGNANTTIDITDVASTATNFLVIEVTTTSATNDKVYGGTVTLA